MAIGSSLGITLPTQGGNTGTWGTDLNTELQKVIDAVEAQVPASAIDFSADFDLNGFSVTGVEGVSFDQQASYTALNSIYFTSSGELAVRDGSNNVVQLTASGSLNTASNGGIGDSGGDYGTNDIVFDWDGTLYNAKNGSGANDYANVRMDELQLRDGSGNDLTVAVPAMSTNYTLTLPAAVAGGATTILQSDASGNHTYSNTFSTDITLSGSAAINHSSRVIQLGGSAWVGTTSWYYDSAGRCSNQVGGEKNSLAIPLVEGQRITNIQAYAQQGSTGTITLALHTVDDTGTLSSAIATDTDTAFGSVVSLTLPSLTSTVVGNAMYLLIVSTSGSGAILTGNAYVTYDRV